MSAELARQIEERVRLEHGRALADFTFRAEGRREATRVVVSFTIERSDRSVHYPMEAGVAFESNDPKPDDVEEALWTAIDFLHYYLNEYLRSHGEILLPLDWMPVPFGERHVFARGWERNLALEEAADRWLAGDPVEVRECVEDKRRRRKQH